MRRSACSRRNNHASFTRDRGNRGPWDSGAGRLGRKPASAVRGRPIAGVRACVLACDASRGCAAGRRAKRGQAVSGRGWEAWGEVPEGGHFFALYTPALGVCRDGRRDLPRVAEGKEVGAAGVPKVAAAHGAVREAAAVRLARLLLLSRPEHRRVRRVSDGAQEARRLSVRPSGEELGTGVFTICIRRRLRQG